MMPTWFFRRLAAVQGDFVKRGNKVPGCIEKIVDICICLPLKVPHEIAEDKPEIDEKNKDSNDAEQG